MLVKLSVEWQFHTDKGYENINKNMNKLFEGLLLTTCTRPIIAGVDWIILVLVAMVTVYNLIIHVYALVSVRE